MLDDLRKATESGYDEYDPDAMVIGEPVREERKFLGMTAVERMFLALFFFMNVLIIGLALLLATGRIVL